MQRLVYYAKLIFFLLLIASSAFAAPNALPIKDLVRKAEASFDDVGPAHYETREVESVGSEIWDRIQVEYLNGEAVVSYLYSKDSLKKDREIFRDLVFLTWFRNSTYSVSEIPQRIELLYNATHNSTPARWGLLYGMMENAFANGSGLAIIERNLIGFFEFIPKYDNFPDAEFETLKTQIMTEIAKESERYLTLQTKELRQREKNWETWKKQTGTLDALDKAQMKLDDYVRNNDRAGARKLIEAYLPWPVMEPFETRMWKSWLEALEKKPTAKESIVLFRGVDYDTDNRFYGKDNRPGFMSPMLTKNQGNYNRRLRSYANRRVSNGGLAHDTEKKIPQIALISKQFEAHAEDPIGSAFLSLTSSVQPTLDFAGRFNIFKKRANGAFMAVRLHPSRAISNGPASSGYVGEQEHLLPLLLFPEDIIYYEEAKHNLDFTSEYLLESLKKVLTPAEHKAAVAAENSYNNKKVMVIDFFKSIEQAKLNAPLCSGVFTK
ncbi:hypothetical protein [Bdellovibrio sp. HCB337]|uniref:hypothetical protein n=1 Tax=Bdellovibrio sp. HCB337 TaxID=3394358 RepID=UPI0039A50085